MAKINTHMILDALGGHGPGTAVDPIRYATLAYGLSFLDLKEGWNGPVFDAFVRGMDHYWRWAEEPDRSAEPPDWCASFVSQCIRVGMGLRDWRVHDTFANRVAGHPFERWLVGVGQIVAWADEHVAWTEDPQPGDIFVEYRQGKALHVGFYVDTVAVDGDVFQTLEGNFQDKVASTYRRNNSFATHRFINWRNA